MSSPLARFQDADWTLVPTYLHRPLERWLTDGIEPCSKFLRTVLRNDLVGSVRQARPIERTALAGIVDFLSNECPDSAYGSVPIYREWQRIGGWRGMRDATDRIGESYDF